MNEEIWKQAEADADKFKDLSTQGGKDLSDLIKQLSTVIKQIDVLETMTSLDFLDFRHHLSPASGFQSHQFRKLEVMLGLKIKDRHQFGGCPYHNQFKGPKKNEILELEDSASLFKLIEKWLERIPFINMENFNFISKYEDAVNEMMNNEISLIKDSHLLNDEDKNLRVRMIDENRKYFEQVFDENTHQKAVENGEISLSYKATMSALLINLYREQPILHLPFKLLKNIDKRLSKETGLPVHIAEDPLACVAVGTGKALEQEEIFSTVLSEY